MSSRELVVLGTASQAPTRHRNHNGYFLRWDDDGFLFDPGEGTQRQLLLAGVPSTRIGHVCITHFHGDHCLGLPGILQRMSLDRVATTTDLCYPASGEVYVERLRFASVFEQATPVHLHPVEDDGKVLVTPSGLSLHARHLDHRVPTVGWRVQEPDGRRFVPERLAELGLAGPVVGQLERDGVVEVDGRRVELDEVSTDRPGQSFAFVMDTRLCDAAVELARGVDLLVCEATYLDAEATLAAERGHLTAAQAATIAREAEARSLVLTHFSARYPELDAHLAEARAVFPETVAVRDLDRVEVPPRQ